jgi:LEA14-like dessication related protein
MKKIWTIVLLSTMLSGCSILSELTALSKCEFSFHSAQDPVVAGIDIMQVQSFSDLTLMDGQRIATQILQNRLPFGITANIEVRNPGITTAALNHIEWIAFIDDVQISSGKVEQRVEILPNGGTAIVPVRIESDLFEYLEGDSPRTMLNFALNLIDAGGQPTRLSLKIKPSVVIGSTLLPYPDYFIISKEYRSGN